MALQLIPVYYDYSTQKYYVLNRSGSYEELTIGGGGSETWQQTLDNGSDLDKDNTVNLNGSLFTFANADQYALLISSLGSAIKATDGTANVSIQVTGNLADAVEIHLRADNGSAGEADLTVNGIDSTITYDAPGGNLFLGPMSTDGNLGLSQDVVIAGFGTLTFTNGLLTAVTPE